MPNRLSLSIFLSFIAFLIAFYSGFVFSQTVPGVVPKLTRPTQSNLVVTVNVLSSCSFLIAQPTANTVDQSPNAQSGGFGARCSVSQPLIVSPHVTSGATGVTTTQAQLQISSGTTELKAQTGTPFWAEATDKGLLVTF